MNEQEAVGHKTKRARSPSYPGIPLRTAIERARQLYNAEGRNAAPIDAIYEHWGYAPKSGAGNVTVAALKKFGLISDEGSGPQRKAKLNDLGLRIILDDRDESPERDEAIRRAALAPKIHRDIWDRYGGNLPSDANLRHFLRLERGFTDSAADELIRELHDTVSFAQLDPSDIVSSGDEEPLSEQGSGLGVAGSTPPTPAPPTGRQRAVQLPLSASDWVTVQAAFPLSEGQWEQMLRVLEAMKPGLVAPNDGAQDEPERG